jgi:hypothetical protein
MRPKSDVTVDKAACGNLARRRRGAYKLGRKVAIRGNTASKTTTASSTNQ